MLGGYSIASFPPDFFVYKRLTNSAFLLVFVVVSVTFRERSKRNNDMSVYINEKF